MSLRTIHEHNRSRSSEHPLVLSRKRPHRSSSEALVSCATSFSLSPSSSCTSLADLVASLDPPMSASKKQRKLGGDLDSRRCRECRKQFIRKQALYMYRDSSYCSTECRDKQIAMDEIAELQI
mmetsp:Transcript_20299/g.38193  ORF Transcript_20299/g.38193 Transcript_20299/m.38193 type:complete len:123 (+) Transcript_20299:132-500(+)